MCKKQEQKFPTCAIQSMFPEFESMDDAEKRHFRKMGYYKNRLYPPLLSVNELHQLPIGQVWELCRVSLSTIHRWRSGKTAMPYATQQLLKYCLYGVVPHGLCGHWGGARFGRDGRLYPANSAYGYTAGELTGFYLTEYSASLVPGLRNQVARLERELDFHKQQTRENSRMGFMRGLIEVLS